MYILNGGFLNIKADLSRKTSSIEFVGRRFCDKFLHPIDIYWVDVFNPETITPPIVFTDEEIQW